MSARIVSFPKRRKTCAMCGGVLITDQPWHRFHLECLRWVYRQRAMPFLLAASDVRDGGR